MLLAPYFSEAVAAAQDGWRRTVAAAVLAAVGVAVLGGLLAYLGIVASGLGFFLFNAGARRSSLPVLAVLNNAKIPLAVVVSVVVFGETIDLARTALGILLFLPALYLAGRTEFARPPRVSDLTGLFISSVFFASTCTMDLIW